MKRILERIKIFMAYWFKARTIYRIHPPYLYKLLDKMFDADQCYYDFDLIWQLQMDTMRQNENISDDQFGKKELKSTIKHTDKSTYSKQFLDQLYQLYRLTYWMKPTRILDLGSGFGMRTATFAMAAPKSKIIGVEEIEFLVQSSLKSTNFNQLNNIEYIHLDMDQFLNKYTGKAFDLVFLKSQPYSNNTLLYLQKTVPFLASNACIIVDGIHSSAEMHRCWKEIIQWSHFNFTVETRHWGMAFCDPTLSPGNYVFCESHWKPWQKYL
ncbi:MAG: methyltransferase domain-containing protein [Saprospiraceae bacterium]|nr:methyltransferase domain-containing protein [Saprospiraceae bacterium]